MTLSLQLAERPKTFRSTNNAFRFIVLCALFYFLTACAQSVEAATYFVSGGADLQAVIDAAQPGDTITVEAGATFVGPITLPLKGGDDYITIQSSRLSELPADDQRVGPQHVSLMARIVSPGRNDPALRTSPGAHHYRLIGIEVTMRDPDAFTTDLVLLGWGDDPQNTLASVPHHLTIDRCYIHGLPGVYLKRGIALNSASTDILNSNISEVHAAGGETQAIAGWNGPGPYRIVNNYIEGAGINLMFGGADARIPGLIPSDIEIRRNYFYKPLSWRGIWTVKNLLELKNAQRVVIEGNVFENNWADAQAGYAILFTPRNDGGSMTWGAVRDVLFTNNIVRNTRHFVSVLGEDYLFPTQRTERITIVNNLFDGGAEGGGWFLLVSLGGGGPTDLHVEHNTVVHTGHAIYTTYFNGNETALGFVYRNNINTRASVGGDGSPGWGTRSLEFRFPGYQFQHNVLSNEDAVYYGFDAWPIAWYPLTTFMPSSNDAIGFVDRASGNYRLTTTSPYKNAATDGKDIGCDFSQLEAAIGGTVITPTASPSPIPMPSPAPTLTPMPTPIPMPPPTGGTHSLSLVGQSYFNVPNSPSLSVTAALTVEAWVKTSPAGSAQSVVERYGQPDGGYGLRLTAEGRVMFFTCQTNLDCDLASGGTTASPGVWHHVAGVFDGSQLRVYLDGVLDGTLAGRAPNVGTSGTLRVGARSDDLGLKFSGLIDEARVTAGALYAANFTPQTQLTAVGGSRGLWKFDGQTGNDSSGNGNHGSLVGVTYSTDVPMGVQPTGAHPTVSALSDDFSDSRRDTAKWSLGAIAEGAYAPAVEVSEQSQRLEIIPSPLAVGYGGYSSLAAVDFTGARASVEVQQTASGADAVSELVVTSDAHNFVRIAKQGSVLWFQQVVNGTRDSTQVPYDAVWQRFWRVRHDAAAQVIIWETSADGADWVQQWRRAAAINVSAVHVELLAGASGADTAWTTVFDNFDLSFAR